MPVLSHPRHSRTDNPLRNTLLSLLILGSGVLLVTTVQAQVSLPEQAEVARLAEQIRALPCREMEVSQLPGREPKTSVGVPDALWTPELFATMRDRALACAQQVSRSHFLWLRSYIDNISSDVLRRADAHRSDQAAAASRKTYLLKQLERVVTLPQHQDRSDLLASIERSLHSSRLDQASTTEITTAINQAKARVEELHRAELNQKPRLALQIEMTRRLALEQKAAAFEVKIAAFDPAVRNLLTLNSGLSHLPRLDANAFLKSLHTGELVLRLCTKRFGTHLTELAEAMRRRRLFERYAQQVHGRSEESLREEREKLGVETGTGRVADLLVADRHTLRQGCDQMLAHSSSFLNFGP